MEGVYQLPVVEIAPLKPKAAAGGPAWQAWIPAAAITGVAYLLHYLPIPPFRVDSPSGARYPVSAAIIAILAGVLARTLLPLPASVAEASKRLARRTIPLTIILTGAGLNLTRLASVGPRAFAIVAACIVVATVSAIWFGSLLSVWRKTAILIGAGTAICGSSAIVAVAPLIEAEDQDLMLSLGAVNILGLALVFALPLAGGLLRMGDEAFGVWAGTSIHAVPQVVATGFAYSQPAGALATLVKLVRVAMLAPFMFALGLWHARRQHASQPRIHYTRLAPGFVWGFLALALLNTLNLLPVLQFRFASLPLSGLLTDAGEILLTLSMAAMGLEVDVRLFAKVGGRAMLAALGASLALCAVSLLLIHFLL